MDKQEIQDYFKLNEDIDIYYEYLLGQRVWYFEKESSDSSEMYDQFKKYISRKLNIPFNNVSIVGSAKTRFSFSPSKNFREFHDKSDFDLILVSRELFDKIWLAYRKISLQEFVTNYQDISSNIFNNFISLKDDDSNYNNQTLIEWQQLVFSFKTELQLSFEIEHEINYRIFKDWESVQDYYLKGINKLKTILNETN